MPCDSHDVRLCFNALKSGGILEKRISLLRKCNLRFSGTKMKCNVRGGFLGTENSFLDASDTRYIQIKFVFVFVDVFVVAAA